MFFKFSKKNLHKLRSNRSYEGYTGLLLRIFPNCCEVTEVLMFFFKFSKKNLHKLRSYRSYDGFSGLLLMFFPTGPKLRGYGSYDAFSNFQKKIFTSYKVTEVMKATQGFC